MIIVKLKGGLGNQLFQYAVGRCISHSLDAELKLDISELDSNNLRSYALGAFNVQERFATKEEVESLMPPKQSIWDRFISIIMNRQADPLLREIIEKHYYFDPHILNVKDDVYLAGYWQSEKYFKDIEHIIRKEFQIKSDHSSVSEALTNDIKEKESVSIHVRRGDYISNQHTSQYHGICELEYYFSAIEIICSQINNPHFFLFSDDPEWLKKHLDIKYPKTNVDYNCPDKAHEDLYLMSLCKHNIIANSTFSWWSAWLNTNPDKIVIAPKKWLKDDSVDTKDLIPEGWMVV